MQQTILTKTEKTKHTEKPTLSLIETEHGIKLVKDFFERELAKELSLTRVSAPRFVKSGTGIQDDLSGTEKPVSFRVKHSHEELEIVHSLAKWKRLALAKYGFKPYTGLYTDMDAIRKDEIVDATHSIYVDQWDWEKIITKEDRSLDFLKDTVKKIYKAMKETEKTVHRFFPQIMPILPEEITFIHSEELEETYPELSPKEREDLAAEKYGAIFIIGIGSDLSSGKPHDVRAPDYDDWTTPTTSKTKGLDGDIIVWHPILKKALELSSMGIRVDKAALLTQLKLSGKEERLKLDWHRMLIEDLLPLSVGGGIGQSRLCMFFLRKSHIGEVQSSIWPEALEKDASVTLL